MESFWKNLMGNGSFFITEFQTFKAKYFDSNKITDIYFGKQVHIVCVISDYEFTVKEKFHF